jgi:gliding motility-associated-like protein
MQKLVIGLIFYFVILHYENVAAQSGLCDPITPFYSVDLTGNPSGTWVSAPPVQRAGNCCGTAPPDKCVEFSITLDSNAVAINFDIASGAIPPGALYYQIGCGPQVQVGQPICLNGPGPYTLTFCKPGNNLNTYAITSIAGPSVSPSDTTSQGCSATMYANGLIEAGITWNSIYPGNPGAYNSFLNCTTGCDTVFVTPQNIYPPYVDYLVCGFPNSGPCAPPGQFCDTVRIFLNAPLTNLISPNPAHYCENTSGIQLNGTINGGVPPYQFFWTNGPNGTGSFVGNTANYFATAPGTYSLTVRDAKYPGCPEQVNNVTVIKDFLPVANAGGDLSICTTNLATALNGTLANASSGIWSGGNGTFSPGNTALNATYTPTQAEVLAGSVNLTLTTLSNSSCPEDSDVMTIFIAQPIQVTIAAPSFVCYNQNSTLTANITGGTPPYTYLWNTGATTQSITNQPPGTYTVTVTDASVNPCSETTTFTITENPQLSVTITPDALVSCNTSVTIIATPQGGTGTYSYLWSNGSTATSIVVPTGTYTVTVTDAANCTASNTVSVSAVVAPLTSTISQPPTLCNGSTAPITIIPSGGYGNYTYLWSTGATGNSINPGAGSYCATVTDGGGCTTTYCVNITQDASLTVTANNPPIVCYGGTATVSITAGGGQSPYTYSWNTGDTTPSITQPAGTYSVTITDANLNSCTAIGIGVITEDPQIILVPSWSDINCNGGSDGTATVAVLGGTAPYYYVWSPSGQSTATATGLLSGTYSVTVTDSIGCTNNTSVTITNPPALVASISSSQNISCYGAANGTATVTATGGTGNYTYSWNTSPVQTNQTATNLSAGTYTATVTDENACTSTTTVTITEPIAFIVTSTQTAPINCFGGNATVTISALGGAPPYSGTGTFTVAAGTYTFTVFDANNCTATTTITVSQPSALSATISSVSNVSCNGGSNGTATVSVTGGTGGYSYSWSTTPVQNAATAVNLASGTYTVTITDVNGCTTTASTAITQPTILAAASSVSSPIPCNGGTGIITVSASGGLTPYTGTGQFTVPVGTYTYTVTDAGGCIGTTTVTVTQPAILTANSTATTPISCNGGTASVTIDGSGGTAPYSGTGIYNVPAGTSTFNITDANGCTASTSITITQPTALSAIIASSSNVSCNGGNNGTATVNVTGGTGNYSYSWNTTPTQLTQTATGLSAGSYTVTVTDANNCTTSTTIVITQPATLNASATVTTPIVCSSGIVTISATGGTAPYTGTGPFTVNAPGTYSYTVTDANNCTATTTITVAGPTQLTASATITTPVLCNGSGGIVTVSASGGTLPYTGTGAYNVTAGTYNYTVTDANGCLATTSITVTEPIAIAATITSSINVTCFGANNGSAVVNVTGGIGPYTYSWNTTPVQTTPVAINLAVGTYFVTVTDANLCTATAVTTINESPQLIATTAVATPILCTGGNAIVTVTASGGTSPYAGTGTFTVQAGTYTYNVSDVNGCTGSSTIVVTEPTPLTATSALTTPVACNGQTGTVSVSASGGTPPYTGTGTFNVNAGTYTYTVTDANNCTATTSITVTQPASLVASIATSANVTCFGGNDGNATVNVTGGSGNYTYNWNTSPVQNTVTAINLAAGLYTVSVTDSNNCVATAAVTITEPSVLTASSAIVNGIACNGSTANILVSATGGTAPYTGTGNFQVAAGSYTYTVTDANNCIATTFITVTEPASITGSLASVTNVICNGASTGAASVQASGGVQPYSYQWLPQGGNAPQATNLPAGNYTVIISDVNGCSDSVTFVITENSAIQIASNTTPSTCGDNGGSANITVTGGTPNYIYTWSNGNSTPTNNGITGGTYTVIVEDANGCTTSGSLTVPNIGNPITVSHTVTNISCAGQNDGAISLSVTGGGSPYSYLWMNGNTNPNLTGLSPGIYTVIVTNNNGCTDSDTVTITQPLSLNVLPTVTNVTCNGYNNGQISLAVFGGVGPYSYQWSPGISNGPIAGSLAPGNYSVTVSDNNLCSQTLNFTITQPTALTSTISGVNITCNGLNDGFISLNTSGGSQAYNYAWTPNVSTGPSASGISAGFYTVVVTDNNGCTTSNNILITEPPPILVSIFGGWDTICIGQSVLISMSANGGTGGFSYLWNPGGQTSNTVFVSPTTTTVYTGYAIDQSGCVGESHPTIIYVRPPLAVNINASSATICPGDSSMLTAIATGGNGNYTYSWSPAIGNGPGPFYVYPTTTTSYTVTVQDDCGTPVATATSTITVVAPFSVTVDALPAQGCAPLVVSFNTTISPTVPGMTYTWDFGDGAGSNYLSPTHLYSTPGSFIVSVVVVSPQGCTISYTLPNPIEVYPSAVADFYPDPDTVLMVMDEVTFINNSGNSTNWEWNFGDGASSNDFQPTHYFNDYGNFNVMLIASNDFGCPDTAIYRILVNPQFTFYVPNAFTPNENLINETFKGYGTCISNCEMYLFDRWGNKMYESFDINNGWDGRANGSSEIAQDDVYVYLFVIKDCLSNKHVYRGIFTLIK